MVKTKLNKITGLVLALVMTFALCLGINGFASKSTANAATTVETYFDAANLYTEMDNGATTVVGNVKLFSYNTSILYTAANKYGYRSENGRFKFVFYFAGKGALDIYHNSNGTGDRYVKLSKFSTTKTLQEIEAADFATTTVVPFTSVEGTTFSVGSGVKATVAAKTTDNLAYNITVKGCMVVKYNTLDAGYYLLEAVGSESYIAGYKMTVEDPDTPPEPTTQKLQNVAVDGYTFIGWTNDNGATYVADGTEVAIADASSYKAVNAKIEYNGASIKTDGDAGVRHEFTVSFSDPDLDETVLQSKMTGSYKFNKYNQNIASSTVVGNTIKIYCVVVGYEANNADHYDYAITANASVKFEVNGVSIETANTTAYTAKAIAEECLRLNYIDATQAAVYGVGAQA